MILISGSSVQVLPDAESVSQEAARIFINTAERCISVRGRFSVAVSGGSTPERLFTLLGSESYADKVDWSSVHFFWVDERCVPKDHEDSNFGGAWNLLLSHLSIPEGNIHRIKGEITPVDGSLEYEKELTTFFGAGAVPAFDLIFLGMGEDGHTASLFPASDSLNEDKSLAVPVYVERLKSWRVTLTLPVLNNAHSVVFLVTGRNKGAVLKEILENKSTGYPAALINPDKGSLTWLIDNDAACRISATPALI